MSKYSLQMECLENIEAFSDEQMDREMAVIESVLEIYDKTILMMELSNTDVDIPDCSMFMESTFFQEDETPATGNPQPTNGGEGGEVSQSAPGTQDGQQQNNGQTENNTQKTPPTEAERKKYNSEHQFRQMNKKGNTENMFISIIAFIPRLFGFLIQCIVKLFKKIGNKKADDAVNNTDKNLGNLNDEQKKQLAAEINKESSSDGESNTNVGKLDVVSGTYTWWNQNSVLEYLENCKKALEGINFSDSKNFINNSTGSIHQLLELVKSYKDNPGNNVNAIQYQNVPGSLLIKSRDLITQKLNDVKALAQSKSDESKNLKFPLIGKNSEKNALETAKNLVSQLKAVIKELAGFTNELWKGVETAANNALAVENFTNGQPQPQNSDSAPQPQPPVSNGGGENNGGQEQNNPANT